MHRLRAYNKTLPAVLLLLVLCLQVQASFACEMGDYSGSMQECCCGETAEQPCMAADENMQCCQYEHTVSVKGADPAQDNPSFVLAKPLELKPPPLIATLALILFDQPVRAIEPARNHLEAPPTLAGTLLYLTTQRLRI